MTGKPAKNFHGFGIGPLSNTLAVKTQVLTIAKLNKLRRSQFSMIRNQQKSVMLSSIPSFLNLVTQKFSNFYLINSANNSSNF